MKKLSSGAAPSSISNPAKLNISRLDIKLCVVGDLIKINADNGATNLKDLLLSTYTVQKTDFIFLPSFFNDTIVEKNIYDHSIQYQLCTSSGQEEHHNIRRLSYPLTNVILLVFHYNAKESFRNAINMWYPEIRDALPKVPVVLLGVKDNFIPVAEVSGVLSEEAKNIAEARGIDLFMECSLRDLNSIITAFNQSLYCALMSQEETKKLGLLAFLRDLNTGASRRYQETFHRYFFNTFGLKSFAYQLQYQTSLSERGVQLTELSRDAHQCVARHLRPSDWLSIQQSCKKINRTYNSEGFWNWSFVHLNFLDSYTRDHAEFHQYRFDPKRVIVALSKHTKILKKIFRWGVDPWQIACLMGLVDQVRAVHGEAMHNLKDENGYGVVHYLILGEHNERVISWLQSINFKSDQDPQYLLPSLAVMTSNKELLQKFVELWGYQITFTDKKNAFTLLHPAVEWGQCSMVPWLIKQGINPVEASKLGVISKRTNLALIAAENDYWKLFAALRKLGVDPYHTPENQRYVALAAIRRRNRSLAQTLIKLYSLDTLAEKNSEGSFFYAAILSGDPETLEFAIKSGWGGLSDRFQCEKRPGRPPLAKTIYHVMAEAGLVNLFEYVVQQEPKGIDVKDLDGDGNSVLQYAAKHGNPIKFRKLFQQYFSASDLLAVNNNKETLAHTGARFGHTEFVYQLYFLCQSYQFDAVAFFSQLDDSENTLLHHAMDGGAVKLALWLVRNLHFSNTALEFQQQIPLRLLADRAILRPQYRIHFEIVVRTMLYEELMSVDCLTEYPDHKGETVEDVMLAADTAEFYEKLCDEISAEINKKEANNGAIN